MIQFVTLTTDYGLSDPYVAALKGQLLRQKPGLQLIDVAHNISKYNLQEAAYVLKNAFHFFPDGTLHLMDVSTTQSDNGEFMLFKFEGHYFVTPNNGVCSLLTHNAPIQPYLVPQGGRSSIHSFSLLRDVLPALHDFLHGTKADELYDQHIVDYEIMTPLLPVISGDSLHGRVIHVDSYENIITNVDRATFKKLVGKDGGFIIHLKKRLNHENKVSRLVNSYEEVGLSEIACFFGHNNLLQIALRGSNASGLLGLKANDPIFIEKT